MMVIDTNLNVMAMSVRLQKPGYGGENYLIF